MPTARYRFAGGGEIVLGRWEQNLDDVGPAFEAMADHQKSIWKKQFDTEGTYTGGSRQHGGPWEPLSANYRAWKLRNYPGKTILRRTDRLFNSLTKRPFGVETITKDTMTIGTDVPYAKYHQTGVPERNLPQRRIIGPPPVEDVKVFAKIMQSWIVRRNVDV